MRLINTSSRRGLSLSSSIECNSSDKERVKESPSGKVCLVMGAGDSIGGAVAKKFAQEGYVTAVARRHKHMLLPLVSEITSFGGSCVS